MQGQDQAELNGVQKQRHSAQVSLVLVARGYEAGQRGQRHDAAMTVKLAELLKVAVTALEALAAVPDVSPTA